MGKGGPKIDGNDTLNVLTNIATYGLVGIDGNGNASFGSGALTRGVTEGVGELTGRNLQRRALAEANDKADVEQRQQATDLKNQQLNDYRADVLASRSAQGVRDTAVARGTSGAAATGVTGQPLGGDEKDLLGL
jgi:hypothetical protein